jgi:hypothetical protein
MDVTERTAWIVLAYSIILTLEEHNYLLFFLIRWIELYYSHGIYVMFILADSVSCNGMYEG